MNVFLYKKRFYLNDFQAENLKLRLSNPYVFLWQDKKDHIYLTCPEFILKDIKYMDCFDCVFTQEGWIINAKLPFPWEKNYCFKKLQKGFYQLINKPLTRKEAFNGNPQIKTVSTRRCKQTKSIQNLRDTESTQNGQDADIIDTLI